MFCIFSHLNKTLNRKRLLLTNSYSSNKRRQKFLSGLHSNEEAKLKVKHRLSFCNVRRQPSRKCRKRLMTTDVNLRGRFSFTFMWCDLWSFTRFDHSRCHIVCINNWTTVEFFFFFFYEIYKILLKKKKKIQKSVNRRKGLISTALVTFHFSCWEFIVVFTERRWLWLLPSSPEAESGRWWPGPL